MALKPFVINLNDLAFLLKQVNFVPLFDAATNGNGLVAFDGTVDAYSSKGVLLWDASLNGGAGGLTTEAQALGFAGLADLGTGFPHASAAIGVRDVSGLYNNLFGSQADWGAVDVPFVRLMDANYDNYATDANFTGDYGVIGSNVTDAMPRIISRTITTADVNLLKDASGQFVEWDHVAYEANGGVNAYAEMINDAGIVPLPDPDNPGAYLNLVDGAKIVVPGASTLAWDPIVYTTSHLYNMALQAQAPSGATDGHLYGDASGGPLEDGGPVYIYLPSLSLYAPLKFGTVPVTFNAILYSYEGLANQAATQNGLTLGSLATGAPIPVDPAELTAVGDMPAAALAAFLTSDSGYGLLETLGHIDFQNPDSGEFFIGSENPGVAPVNSWFAIFGQFFDHGLDFIGKGGAGTITIALQPGDPLYREPGTNGPGDPGNTAITISRATPTGTDANGDAAYVNHTSPFIDQSQTYGSVDQITNILRKWETTDGGLTYHAGIELLDGTTLVDAWERKWPDDSSTWVHDTLPTLNELRQHVIDTDRAAITWEDVLDLRNRDGNGQLLDTDATTAGVQTTGSGHALLLDMNPSFNMGTFNASTLSSDNAQAAATTLGGVVATDNSSGNGDGITAFGISNGTASDGHGGFIPAGDLFITTTVATMGGQLPPGTYTGAVALMASGWIDHNFNIVATDPAVHAAVGEILMASVGNHYVAGDGRVNENFGLTSIHHVFHEEHNYQVENLKTWIYAHDANNPGATDIHEQLHNWQINNNLASNNMDANGNYLNIDGSIAWDPDKMFEATKLVVEMEYQHAAVDQYARTVTPRIQEFVGYSTGVDSTISLEYAQVAFRFGHSTIRETIDTIDPDGWYTGSVMRFALEKAFLAPQTFAKEGVAAITLGLTHQQMNEVDEFVTPALNQGLLGQPLDLASINIARGRDLGIPTLNEFRAAISLAQYTSWADFGAGMQHPESLVNFIAAYSFNGDVAAAEAAMLDVNFMNNTPGTAGIPAGADAFNQIDSWIGGLAEVHVPGGLLGETFDAVFVAQIQALMDGDRFYYLYRLFGTQIHEEVNNGQFKDIVERNTGLEHLNGSIFAYADKYYDFNRNVDGKLQGLQSDGVTVVADTTGDHANHLYSDLLAANATRGVYSDGGDLATMNAQNGTSISVLASDGIRDNVTLTNLIRDVRAELDPTQVHTVEGTPTSGADSHEVIVATNNADFIHARAGDDTIYGEGGDDYIYGDGGVDRTYGGDGNDLIDTGEGPDLADGGSGKDIIYGRGSGTEVGGFDQLVGGSGNDLVIGGEGIDKLSGGSGDDIIYGDGLTNPEMGNTDPFTHAGDGNDYVDGGASGDLLFGEEGDDYIVGGNDQDLMQGGYGDDIIRPGNPSQASGTTGGPDEVVGDDAQANVGFDLIDFSDYAAGGPGVVIDFATQNNPLVAIDQNSPFPAWFQIEGAIGTSGGDTFIGDSLGDATADNSLGNNWLIGGSGSDTFTGAGGNDIIIGGSIRLDSLIGSYAGADFGNLTLGSMDWLKDAMQTGDTGTGYNNNTEDAYTGASNRALGAIGANGLIDAANALGGAQFDKHFTDMLQSRMFKDTVLGDGGTDGTADTVKFIGNLSEYSIEVVNFTAPNGQAIQALKITDHGGLVDDGNGVLVPRATDGVDLLVGVEQAIFADQTVSLVPSPPGLDLNADHIVTTTTNGQFADNFNTAAFNNSTGTTAWATTWSESGDITTGNVVTGGQIQLDAGGGGGSNQLRLLDNGDGASIQRTVDLSGVSTANLSFSYQLSSFDGGTDRVVASFSFDNGATWHVINTMQGSNAGSNNNNGNGSVNNLDLSTLLGPGESFGSQGIIKFEAITSATNGGVSANNGYIAIDNLTINTSTTTTTNVAGATGTGHTASYNEDDARAAITSFPSITDDSATIASAKVVLTNAIAGDALRIGNSNNTSGNLGGNNSGISYAVDNSVAGQITLTITGTATKAQYQGFLDQVRYFSTSDNPTAGGANTRTIDVTVSDGLWTSNVATTTVNVTAVNDAPNAGAENVISNFASGQAFTVAGWALLANDTDPDGPNPLTITDVTEASGSFTASLAAGDVSINNSSTGNPSFTYTVSDQATPTPGTSTNTVSATRDTTGNVDGNNSNTRDILIGNDSASTFDAGTGDDIVLAGGGDDNIVWNANNGGITDGRDIVDGGANGAAGDRFTATGNGSAETFDIYAMTDQVNSGLAATLGTTFRAETKIVITRTVGGTTAVIAELTDIEELTIDTVNVTAGGINGGNGPGTDVVAIHGNFGGTGLNPNTITISGGDGHIVVDVSEMTSSEHVVLNTGGTYEIIDGGTGTNQVTVNGTTDAAGGGTTDPTPAPTGSASIVTGGEAALIGTAGADVIAGTDANKVIHANGGDDVVTTGDAKTIVMAGDGDDIVDGGGAGDIIFGGDGEDIIDGMAGNDKVFGEDGDDLLYGREGDDMLFGGAGADELRGGTGADRIEGGEGADLLAGGDGDDQFVFRSASEADGDTIADFQSGDVIDLSFIDGNGAGAGNGSFSILSANAFTASGQLIVHYDATKGATILEGNTDGNNSTAEFTITVDGDHVTAFVQNNGSAIV